LLSKKRAGDRKTWLEEKGDLATLEVWAARRSPSIPAGLRRPCPDRPNHGEHCRGPSVHAYSTMLNETCTDAAATLCSPAIATL